jgi:hypothetical protein
MTKTIAVMKELARLFTVWGLGVGGGMEIYMISADREPRCPLRRLASSQAPRIQTSVS